MTHDKNLRSIPAALIALFAALTAAGCADEPTACLSPEVPTGTDPDVAGVAIGDVSCSDVFLEPYAVGAEVKLLVPGIDPTAVAGLAYEASNPGVVELTPGEDGVGVRLLAAGRTRVIARDPEDEHVVAEVGLESLAATDVHWQVGAQMLGAAGAVPYRPRVVVGGRAPVLATLYAGDTALRGAGALSVLEGPARLERGRASHSDWVVLEPTEPGPTEVVLDLGDGSRVSYPFAAVPVENVTRLELSSIEDGYAGVDADGATRARPSVYVLAYTSDGVPALGAPARFRLDEDELEARGDVFQYTLDPAQTRTVTASLGELEAAVVVHAADADSARVVTGDELVCSAGGNPAAGLGLLATVGFALLVVGRRRFAR